MSNTPVPETLQMEAQRWMAETFGQQEVRNTVERNHRFLEEALELVQACGCTREDAHVLVDYVFNRPVGEIGQEVGGAALTLFALCNAQGRDFEVDAKTEMQRAWVNKEKIRAKQARKPRGSPLPGATT